MSRVFRRPNVLFPRADQSQETPQCELGQAKEGPFPPWEKGKREDGFCAPFLQPHLFPFTGKAGLSLHLRHQWEAPQVQLLGHRSAGLNGQDPGCSQNVINNVCSRAVTN